MGKPTSQAWRARAQPGNAGCGLLLGFHEDLSWRVIAERGAWGAGRHFPTRKAPPPRLQTRPRAEKRCLFFLPTSGSCQLLGIQPELDAIRRLVEAPFQVKDILALGMDDLDVARTSPQSPALQLIPL
jgi:hypothetical protein